MQWGMHSPSNSPACIRWIMEILYLFDDVNTIKKNRELITQKGVLTSITPQKLNQIIGEVTSLMMLSKVHRKMQVRDIADIILPPINLNQFRIYYNSQKEPVGFVTWGNFDEATLQKYLLGDTILTTEEWNGGDNLFFTDFIAPFGHTKKIFKDLTHNIFPNKTAQTIRFTEQGKHRKRAIKLYGKNLRGK